MDWVDLRSDTITRPTEAMREAGIRAPVGDDVFGDDPTINALQARLAGELGFEAGLFVASGTQSNLIALMAHCERGDEYLVGSEAHTYKYEGGGAAVLGSIQPQPIPQAADGTLPLDAGGERRSSRRATRTSPARACWRWKTPGAAACCRATTSRRPARWRARAGSASTSTARACSTPRSPRACRRARSPRHFDSVSVCFSKGLGAPIGSMLLGSEALVARARRWRKVVGGGWRQAGLVAAMANHALDHHVARLADDHRARTRTGGGAAPRCPAWRWTARTPTWCSSPCRANAWPRSTPSCKRGGSGWPGAARRSGW